MELVNSLHGIEWGHDRPHESAVLRFALETVVLLLSPIVPHMAEELWQALGHDTSILLAQWPQYQEDALVKDDMLIVIQVNGKLRSRFTIAIDADDDMLKARALADDRIKAFVDGKPIKKVIVVKNKLVNIVI